MAKKHTFQHVALQQVSYKELGKRFYRVYRTMDDFVDIDAQTAYEAIINSKVQKPMLVEFKVCRLVDFVHDPSLLQPVNPEDNKLVNTADVIAEVVPTQV